MSRLILVLGGARSGKSRYATQRARALAAGAPVAYIATAQARDEEMAERIARHKSERPQSWITLEEPLDAASALREAGSRGVGAILLDCITLLLTNHLLQSDEVGPAAFEARFDDVIDALVDAARHVEAPVLLVSNEVGLSVVPEYPLGRLFRDVAGRANQRLAAASDEVVFLVAGIPMTVKSS